MPVAPQKDLLHSERALLSGRRTLLSISWERQTHIPIMTSVGREKKRLRGGGARDCHSSEAKYLSKERAEEKGRKATEAFQRRTIDQSLAGNSDGRRRKGCDVEGNSSFKELKREPSTSRRGGWRCDHVKLGYAKVVSLKKGPQGPIETPPSVQNPQEGQSRSAKVTFQRGNQKKEKKRQQGEEEEAERASRSSMVLRSLTDWGGGIHNIPLTPHILLPVWLRFI